MRKIIVLLLMLLTVGSVSALKQVTLNADVDKYICIYTINDGPLQFSRDSPCPSLDFIWFEGESAILKAVLIGDEYENGRVVRRYSKGYESVILKSDLNPYQNLYMNYYARMLRLRI